MSAGLRVYNDTNTLVIDENHVCPSFIGKYGLSADTYDPNLGPWGLYSTTFSYTGGDAALFVLHSPNGITCISDISDDGAGHYNVTILMAPFNTGVRGFTLYVFDRPNNSGDVGLKVRDAGGNMVFNSNCRPLKLFTNNSPSGPGPFGFSYKWGIDNTAFDTEVPGPGGTPSYQTFYTTSITGAYSTSSGVVLTKRNLVTNQGSPMGPSRGYGDTYFAGDALRVAGNSPTVFNLAGF